MFEIIFYQFLLMFHLFNYLFITNQKDHPLLSVTKLMCRSMLIVTRTSNINKLNSNLFIYNINF